MKNADLVRMANQIADFFAAYPKGEALDGIAKHVHLFWEPRMRDQMKAYIDAGGEGLRPLFVEAAHDYFKGPKTPPSKITTPDKRPNVGAEISDTRGT